MEYGLFGKKYVLRTFEGEITLHGEREDLPKEGIFEKEQELSQKHIHSVQGKLCQHQSLIPILIHCSHW